jgi:hypothetical protein
MLPYLGIPVKKIRLDKDFTLVILVVISITLAGCQSRGEAQTMSPTTVNSSSPFPEGTVLRPLATVTLDISATASYTPMAEQTSTPENTASPEFTATPENTATPDNTSTPQPTPTPLPRPFLDQFASSLINGNAKQVVGVFVDGVLALRVVQQPASDPAYVSSDKDVATYFSLASKLTGNTGLLAHNNLAGNYFFNLKPGQSVALIYGDGNITEYVVSDIDQFQAISPSSPTSNFVNLSTGETLTATDLFYLVYGGNSQTTFQTCIAQGNDDSWGRLFVVAPQQ